MQYGTLTQFDDGSFVALAHPNRIAAENYRRFLWRSPFTTLAPRTCEVTPQLAWPSPRIDPCDGEMPEMNLDLAEVP